MTQVTIEKFGEILNERPEGMTFEDYKQKRREQTMKLKGFNVQNGTLPKTHIMGRLEGVLIPSNAWTRSIDFPIVLR